MPTIGEQLKQAREARKLTIKQAVLATRVGAHYLEAIEADDLSVMPSNVQARGFLRLYADFLGLNTDELIAHQQAGSMLETLPPAAGENQPPPELPAAAPEAASTPEAVPAKGRLPETESGPEPTPEPGPPLLSQAIFNEIGSSLRERRELISLTLEEVERHTHVRKHNLEMIEAGSFDDLASPVQARGTLNAYARFLDMDSEAVLLRYADALQSGRLERQQAEPPRTSFSRRRISLPVGLRRFISPDLIFGGSMILIMLALSIWGAARIFSGGQEVQSTPTSGPSISDVLLASPDVTLVPLDSTEAVPTSLAEIGTGIPIDAAILGTETETLVPTVASAVQITVVVVDRTFLRVIVDGEVKQDGRVPPGAALTFDGNERIEVLTGSGNAVQIIFNQRDLGQMGNMGEVVNRIYTVNGVETPTPTASPTPSITPKPSRTLRPTLTSPPTATLRPTRTPLPTSTLRP
jgi:cytoskeleton protein RodZ